MAETLLSRVAFDCWFSVCLNSDSLALATFGRLFSFYDFMDSVRLAFLSTFLVTYYWVFTLVFVLSCGKLSLEAIVFVY